MEMESKCSVKSKNKSLFQYNVYNGNIVMISYNLIFVSVIVIYIGFGVSLFQDINFSYAEQFTGKAQLVENEIVSDIAAISSQSKKWMFLQPPPKIQDSRHSSPENKQVKILDYNERYFLPFKSNELATNGTLQNEINRKSPTTFSSKYDQEEFSDVLAMRNFTNTPTKIRERKKPRVKHGKQFDVALGKGKMQEKSYKIMRKWLVLNPVNWMTKVKNVEGTNATSNLQKLDDFFTWNRLKPVDVRSKNKILMPANTSNAWSQNNHNFGNFLSVLTIIKFDNVGCTSAEGVQGICLHKSECEQKNGKFHTSCAKEQGVCCYIENTCGGHSKENATYFINPGFPAPSTLAPGVCTLTLDKMHPKIQQLRLDFVEFQLRDPSNGTCLHDRLIITGQNSNNIIPALCGSNAGQHVYVDVDESNGPFTLSVVTTGEYFPRYFRIKILQLQQGDEFLSPKHCLQYHIKPTGIIQTFNYKRYTLKALEIINSGYFNNLNYGICIRKAKGYCTISYENLEIDSEQPAFQLINVNEEGERLLPPLQAGVETFDCPDDYLSINGMRLCGEKLNDASTDINLTKNFPITDISNGPFMLQVKTDASKTGRGFYLTYTQNPCTV